MRVVLTDEFRVYMLLNFWFVLSTCKYMPPLSDVWPRSRNSLLAGLYRYFALKLIFAAYFMMFPAFIPSLEWSTSLGASGDYFWHFTVKVKGHAFHALVVTWFQLVITSFQPNNTIIANLSSKGLNPKTAICLMVPFIPIVRYTKKGDGSVWLQWVVSQLKNGNIPRQYAYHWVSL